MIFITIKNYPWCVESKMSDVPLQQVAPHSIQRELELLEKLYTLYITVLQKVNGYADLLWTWHPCFIIQYSGFFPLLLLRINILFMLFEELAESSGNNN